MVYDIEYFKRIVRSHPRVFMMKLDEIDGNQIFTFTYRRDSGLTIQEFKEYGAIDARGISFVQDKFGTVSVFPMLHKFANAGEEFSLNELLGTEVESIQVKADGSLLGFIIVNGKVIPKTKIGFTNEFTAIGEKWVENCANSEKIKDLYKKGICPLFEVVSPKHKIVLDYEKEELILIQARRLDGTYLSTTELSEIGNLTGWKTSEAVDATLKQILMDRTTITGIEGFVVRFKNGTFVKVKTDWYFEQHLNSEGADRLNEVLTLFFKNRSTESKIKVDLIEFESKFLKGVKEFLLDSYLKFDSIQDFRRWLRANNKTKEYALYQKYFRDFLREYLLYNNFNRENAIIKAALEGRLDDELPKMEKIQKKKAEEIQSCVFKILESRVSQVFESIKEFKDVSGISMNVKFQKDLAIKTVINNSSRDEVREEIKKHILHTTRKVSGAREFLRLKF